MACQPLRRRYRAALCAAVLLALGATGAQAADQFRQAADGSSIECAVSARELTRFALIDDQFASVSKISSGTPYNDFAVTNEPLRGDIYVSVPETFAARAISFFATTRKGYVYKLACKIEPIPAVQVFIANPAIAQSKAADWERETPLSTSAVRLIQAMANDRTVEGFEVRQSANPPARVGDLEVQLLADYRGAELAGKVKPCDTSGLDANEAFAKANGFTGTPVLVRPSDGAVLEGYRPAAVLREFLRPSTAALTPSKKG